MLNKNCRFEVLSLRLSKYKVIFKKYPSKENDKDVIYFIDIFKKRSRDDKSKNVLYSNQLFHKQYSANDKFEYEFNSDGLWKCLEDVLASLENKKDA